MEAQYKRYAAQGLLTIAVLMENDSRGSGSVSTTFCNNYKAKYNFSFPTVIDEGARILRSYMSGSIPLNIVISTSDMKIRYKTSGYSSRIDSTISSLLSSP